MNNQKHPGLPEFDPADIVASEVIPHAGTTNDRSIARRVALQVLYEVDSAGHNVGEVIDMQLAYQQYNEKMIKYLRFLVLGVLENREKLDTTLQQFAPEWPLNQVAIVDRNILRIAVFECFVENRTPVRVAIDEAVELAKLFGAEGAARFVNGVLGSLADDIDNVRRMLGVDEVSEE